MKYRLDKYGNKLSVLGFGCMRFPRNALGIDMKEVEREILYACKYGVNYFDTAYIYPGSEAAVGEIFEKHGLRSRVKIATKLPHYLIKSREELDRLFEEELRRLRTDHVDYYLMHMLTDTDTWKRLIDLGIEEWLAEKKACGAIRQVGFSYHGNAEMFCALVDAYDWDMCLIQYNYMDEHSQAGRRGLHYAHAKGLPVMIMEPLRGGALARNVPKEILDIYAEADTKRSPVEWAFRWLYDKSPLKTILSGMSSEEQLMDNIRIFSEAEVGVLTEAEKDMMKRVRLTYESRVRVGCTGCEYCMPCPKGVKIPKIFRSLDNAAVFNTLDAYKARYAVIVEKGEGANNCVRCGLCEKQCPQHIAIRDKLREIHEEFA